MKRLLLLPLLLLVLAIYSCLPSRLSWHQRLTVIVDTPQGEVRGAAVTEVILTDTDGPLVPFEARGVSSWVTGEAVVVEIAPGQWLFALLSGEGGTDAAHLVYAAYDLESARGPDGRHSYEAAMARLREQPMDVPAPLPMDGLPLLVTFDDITHPETVRLVDPADLAASFGPGVRLKTVTLEITDEPVTEGATLSLLTWLQSIGSNRLDGQRFGTVYTSNPFANSLAAGLFTTEIRP